MISKFFTRVKDIREFIYFLLSNATPYKINAYRGVNFNSFLNFCRGMMCLFFNNNERYGKKSFNFENKNFIIVDILEFNFCDNER